MSVAPAFPLFMSILVWRGDLDRATAQQLEQALPIRDLETSTPGEAIDKMMIQLVLAAMVWQQVLTIEMASALMKTLMDVACDRRDWATVDGMIALTKSSLENRGYL